MYVTMSVDIEAPPTRVWQFLVEPEKAKAWFHVLEVYEWTSERPGVGSTFHWLERSGAREYSLDFQTTEWEPPRGRPGRPGPRSWPSSSAWPKRTLESA